MTARSYQCLSNHGPRRSANANLTTKSTANRTQVPAITIRVTTPTGPTGCPTTITA